MRLLLTLICISFVWSSPAAARDSFLETQFIPNDLGIEAWLVQDPTLPIISMRFAFRNAGSKNETPETQGLARLVSNTLDEGAGELDSQSFQKELLDQSITLSFSSSRDHFSGTLRTRTETANRAYELLGLALTEPRFDAAPVERMRAANIARIRSSLSDPSWRTARIFYDRIFQGHPYALNSGGTVATLSNLSPGNLQNYVDTHFSRDRLSVAIVGQITPQQAAVALNTMFGALPAEAPTTQPPLENALDDDPAASNESRIYLHEMEIPQSVMQMALPAVPRAHPDYYPLVVMNHIFGGGGFGSRLTEEIREKRGLTYGIHSGLWQFDHAALLTINVSTANETAEEVLGLIQTEMERMQAEPVGAEELNNAQSYLTGSLPLMLDSTGGIANIVNGLQLEELPPNYFDTYPDKIRAVSAEDIQRMAQTYLKPERLMIIMSGQPLLSGEPPIVVEELPNAD